MNRVGIVVIGRNEAVRLDRCLASVVGCGVPIIYVDSGSTDGSAAIAERCGVTVELLSTPPYTAARGRNAGAHRLLTAAPQIEFVQFLDADCELAAGWLAGGMQEMHTTPQLAVVCGRRHERRRAASIYSRLYDIEWQAPLGDVDACGGDALVRLRAFNEVGGYNEQMPAGEEPEMCLRLRTGGWRIRRITAAMSVHDSGATGFGKWWVRARRSGYAYANGAALHHGPGEWLWVRQSASAWLWGLVVPLAMLAFSIVDLRWAAAAAAAYPLLMARAYRGGRRRGLSRAESGLYAAACVVAKVPEFAGQLHYLWRGRSARRQPRSLIASCG